MSTKQEENDIYVIPPNFIETGTLFGGTIKIRNAIEALILTILIGVPVFNLPFRLTTNIIIACLTVLPAALFAIIGIDGDSLSSFIIHYFRFLKNRRIIGVQDSDLAQSPGPTAKKQKKVRKEKNRKEDFAEEFGKRDGNGKKSRSVSEIEPLNPAVSHLPIRRIDHGIIYTTDHRYVKIIEVLPINFLLRSAREQRNIIYSFVSYLKICPVKLQFKVLTKRADINRHLETIQEEMRQETDERCLALQKDYENLIKQIGSKEAITRRFFIIFEYEPLAANRGDDERNAISVLNTTVRTASTYLQQCGNEIVHVDNENEMIWEVFYHLLNRRTSSYMPFSTYMHEVIAKCIHSGSPNYMKPIVPMEYFAPQSIDYTMIWNWQ